MMSGQRSFTATEARQLLRQARTATLSTLNRDDGMPYVSLVNVATDVRGWPLILISTLAWHTKNLLGDSRASVLVAEPPADGDALTGPRVTVMGHFAKVEDEALARRYLARHPLARQYSGFGDFAYWRLEPSRAHAVAGFGRIETMDAVEVFPSADAMIALEEDAIQHMNDDHAEAVQYYAGTLLGAVTDGWKIAAIDTDGVDLLRGGDHLRLKFEAPVATADSLRRTLAGLARHILNE